MDIATPRHFTDGALSVDKRYDPQYDPLVAPDPGAGRAYAPTYWVASAGTPPDDDGPIVQDTVADVVIVGSGSTGISTALYLAQEHGIRALVLEANQTSWGCSSRSGGQGQNASGRLKRSQWIERWGLDVARKLDTEIRTGFDNFRQLTREIDCDAFDGGHLYLAHRPEKLDVLRSEARVMNDSFGYATRMLSAEEIRRDYCDERETAGGLLEAEGVGIHPLKFSFGLIRKARALGVKIHPASPVQGWQTIDGVHHLRTPGGTVRAKRVAVCTGGYTGQALSPLLKNKIMPILSNNCVTRLLSDAELAACNFRSQTFLTDTRTLRFYYRLLEGRRWPSPADRQPQRGDGRGCRRPDAPEAADGCHRAQVPAARRHRHRPLVVGLGRREPRHDAAHRPARPSADGVVRARLWRQRRVLLHLGRQAAGRARRGPGRRP